MVTLCFVALGPCVGYTGESTHNSQHTAATTSRVNIITIMETYEAMSYRQLQAAAKKAGVKASGSKVDILKRMEEYLAEQTSTTDEPRESSTPERAATSTEAPDSRGTCAHSRCQC